MDKLFQGKNGYFWFFGTVEDNGDPLALGRVRVRISGWHNPDFNVLPTDSLPWAYCLTPITNTANSGKGVSPIGPVPGTTVYGFFSDGEAGQTPIITHTVPGIKTTEKIRKIQNNSTPWLPNFISGKNKEEQDCADGYEETSVYVNSTVPDVRDISINPNEWSIPFSGFVSSGYGEGRGAGSHKGVDICPAGFFPQTDIGADHLGGILRGPTGLPCYAAADGEVVFIWTADKGQRGISTSYDKTGTGSRSYGNAVAIRHTLSTGTFTTIYAHLGVSQDAGKDAPGAGIDVTIGQKVKKGQQIGTVGRSHVWDSLTHLHFEIRVGSQLPKASNTIHPGTVFPQLLNRHSSFLSVTRTSKYNINPLPFKRSDMPVKAKDRPK